MLSKSVHGYSVGVQRLYYLRVEKRETMGNEETISSSGQFHGYNRKGADEQRKSLIFPNYFAISQDLMNRWRCFVLMECRVCSVCRRRRHDEHRRWYGYGNLAVD